jgi:Rieske Fe-S protein
MDNNDKPVNQSRRNFMSKLFMGGGLLASSALIMKYGLNYIFPSIPEPPLRKLLVGKVNEIAPGDAKEIHVGEKSLFLIKGEDGFKVFSSVCTHLGCKISWESYRNRFYCPCHKGFFDSSGKVIEGPPPRSLDEYKVEVDKNLVYMWIREENRGGV